LSQYSYYGRQSASRCGSRCVAIQDCQQLLSLLKQRPLQPQTIAELRQAQCGFEGTNPKVCCPQPPEEEVGLQNTPSEEDIMKSQAMTQASASESHPSDRLLGADECGIDNSQRIWGGNRTDLEQYPWAALLQYQISARVKRFACGGALITKRYVLTAAHCLSRDNLRRMALLMVRLGEFDTETDPDCEEDLYSGKNICAPSPQDMGIERIILPPSYDARSINRFGDIGLIRLDRDVQINDFVKPICLPFDDTAPDEYLGMELRATGWGRTETMKPSNVKLQVWLPVVSNEECGRIYGGKGISIGDGQLCAGGAEGKDTCIGDSGGPLMGSGISPRDGRQRFFVAGIVSYGPESCGTKGWPGVYTRVSQYKDWILNQIQE